MVLLIKGALAKGSDTCRKARHDDDSGHLHDSLSRDGHEIAVRQPRNPGRVGVVPLQLQTDPQIRGQQVNASG